MDKMPDTINKPSENKSSEIAENEKIEREQRKKEVIALVIEFGGEQVVFSFPGIDPETYAGMKKDEEEFPGYTTPIDELIERFKNEGMKIILGKHPENGEVFVLPAQSSDIESDSISPRHLQINDAMEEKFKELILLYRKYKNY